MNFLTICQNMADRLDRDRPLTVYNADLSLLSQTIRRYREHVNSAYNMVLLALNRVNENRETSTTLALVSGTENYDIPAGILNIDQVQIGTDPPLDIIQWTDYEIYKRQFLLVTDTGYPQTCSIYQRQIWFYPKPDQNLTANLRGQESLTELNQDADMPDLAADYHRVIQEIAIYYEMVYKGSDAAGVLAVSPTGQITGQGGQAATAINLLRLVMNNSGDHFEMQPRMMSRYESINKNALRRVIYYRG